jgi:hypothetical protein
MAANGRQIGEGADFDPKTFARRTNIEFCTNVQSKPFARSLAKFIPSGSLFLFVGV